MHLWQALLLGLVEGLTEFLPVSSTGHLLVVQRLLGIPSSPAANAYAIAIQAGAILAVVGLYRARLAQMVAGVVGRDREGAKLVGYLLLAFAPVAVLGLAFDKWIERHLFGPWPIVAAWTVGGLLLLRFDRQRKPVGRSELASLNSRMALSIGVAQCAALWPGTSRSLATILGGLASRLSLNAAVEFSFLLGLVTLGAATGYKALAQGRVILEAYGVAQTLAGVGVAWIAATFSVRWMVAWLSKRGLGIFAWWRLGAAMVVAALLIAKVL